MVTAESSKVNKRIAALRKAADSMTKQIEAKIDSATSRQRPTPRRARIAGSMEREGRRLQQIQHALRALEGGTLPDVLGRISSRAQVEEILASRYYESARLKSAGIDSEEKWTEANAALGELTGDAVPAVDLKETKIRAMERELLGTRIPGFFPTPREVVLQMLAQIRIEPGAEVLEPEAGAGHIADVIRELHPEAKLSVIECNQTLRNILHEKGHELIGDDFLKHQRRYDAIVMNPPFERFQDIDHLRHAFSLLNPGGVVVSIVGEGAFFRTEKKAVAFRSWLDEVEGHTLSLPPGTFSGTLRATGVKSRIVTLRAPEAEEKSAIEAAADTEDPVSVQVKAEPNGILSPDETQEELQMKTPAGDCKSGRFTVIRNELEETLRIARDFADRKTTLPVLSHVRLRAEGETCTVEATDLESAWRKQIVANPVHGAVDICVPLELLFKEVAALHADIKTVVLSFKGNRVTVNGRCEIFTLSGDEFPALPTVDGEEATFTGLPTKLRRVVVAAGESDTRYVLNGVYLDRGRGHLVATDGHRLHIEDIEAHEGAEGIIISRKAALIMAKNGADTLAFGTEHLACALAGGVMVTRIVPGDYPRYEQVIPQGHPVKATFRGGEMLKVLEGAVPLVAAKGNAVRLSFNGQIDVRSANPDLGEYNWHVPCDKTGADIVLALNAQYLIDSIRAYTTKENDTVIMEMHEPLSPVLINGKVVVMPMRQ